jgi:outer membrane protein
MDMTMGISLLKMGLTDSSIAWRPLLAVVRLAILAFGLLLPMSAFSELTTDTLLGPGLRWRPAYDGSASQRIEAVPVVRYFGQPWFVRSTQGVLEGGLRFELAPGLHAGAQLAYESGRNPNDADFLKNHNVSGINNGTSIGAHLEWDHKFGIVPVTLLARARQNTDSDLGGQLDLRLSAGIFQSGRVAAGIFTQSTWANAKSTSAFYAITPAQSAVTGLPAFAAGSGWLYSSIGLLWSVDLAQHWIVVGSLEARHLHGDAAQSPLTERTTNAYVSAGLAYRF